MPPAWVVVRLLALAGAALLLSGTRFVEPPFRHDPVPVAPTWLRALALATAVAHALSAAAVPHLETWGQTGYLLALLVPAALLALPRAWEAIRTGTRARAVLAVGAVILVWAAWSLVADVHSPRAADPVDTWREEICMSWFVARPLNALTADLDTDLPGVPAASLLLQGLALFKAQLLPFGFGTLQVFHILWLSAAAAMVGALAAILLGRRVAVVAVAAFLWAPFTRFIALNAGLLAVGIAYATAVVLAAVVACRRRSEAALAALGGIGGSALSYPALIPTVCVALAGTLWSFRRDWRTRSVGLLVAAASFLAAVLPYPPLIFTLHDMAGTHFELQGRYQLLEDVALGQASQVETLPVARATIVQRPLDVAAGAALSPFAVARTPMRLWGDTLFDPVTTLLLAVGCMVALRSALRSTLARLLLAFLGITLGSALLSNVDRANLTRALCTPIPVALLAAAGCAAVARQLAGRTTTRFVGVTAVLVAVSGLLIFDVVNPRILKQSSVGIMFRALDRADDPQRVVVLDYPHDLNRDVKWLFTGPRAMFVGREPVGYLPLEMPLPDFVADGRDLIFWSPGLEHDFKITDAICARWPDAILYEIRDPSGLSRVHAAALTARPWRPAGRPSTTGNCRARPPGQVD